MYFYVRYLHCWSNSDLDLGFRIIEGKEHN